VSIWEPENIMLIQTANMHRILIIHVVHIVLHRIHIQPNLEVSFIFIFIFCFIYVPIYLFKIIQYFSVTNMNEVLANQRRTEIAKGKAIKTEPGLICIPLSNDMF